MSDTTTVVVIPDETTVLIEQSTTTLVSNTDATQVNIDTDETTIITQDDTILEVVDDIQTVVVFTDQTIVVNEGAAGPQGAPGLGTSDIQATAGQALSAGRLVTLDTSEQAVYYDSTTVASYGKAVGVTTTAVASGSTATITVIGRVSLVGAGMTPGQRFWAGPNGTLVTTPPTTGVVVPVGYAVDSDTLFVQLGSYLEW